MNIKTFLFDDDRGVSPVIGVILMVAITVILAAVIAAFVLGLGDTNSTAPSVTFDYDYTEGFDNSTGTTNSTVEVEVTSGESFDASLVEYQVDSSASSNSTSFSGSTLDGEELSIDGWSSGTSAGDTIVIELGGGDAGTSGTPVPADANDFELDLIFTSEDGGTSSEIGGTTGPDA
jgi:flagellin-like protein